MCIVVTLSLASSLQDLQKMRYKFPTYTPNMKYGRGSTGLGQLMEIVYFINFDPEWPYKELCV